MITIAQTFHDFLARLELTPEEEAEASRQQADLMERLRSKLLGVVSYFIVGSYARKTSIRPLNDIDLFLVLNLQQYRERLSRPPNLLLEDVQRALRQCYSLPGPETRIQRRSVNVTFQSTGIGYDVIPAFAVALNDGDTAEAMTYMIPNRSQDAEPDWIRTNPKLHARRCKQANDRAQGMLNRLIKAAKHWNQSHRDSNGDKPLRSFHLEVMAYEAFDGKAINERVGLRDLFAFLANRVLSPCPDPARLGPDLDKDMSEQARQRAHVALKSAAELANEAVWDESDDDDEAAYEMWRALLGPELKY